MGIGCGTTSKLNLNFENINQVDCDPPVYCFPSTNGQPTDDPPVPSNDTLRRDPTTKFLWLYTCDGGWECFAPAVDCILSTEGQPTDDPPAPKNSTIRHDSCAGLLWVYKCDGGWTPLEISLCSLEELDPQVINDICNTLRLPAFYDSNGCCAQGYFTLSDLWQVLLSCIDVCDLLGDIDAPGATVDLEPGDEFISLNPANCTATRYRIPECETYICENETAVGGGMCVNFSNFSPDADGLVIYQSRDQTIIHGTVDHTALNPPGFLQVDGVNPFDCPALFEATLCAGGQSIRHSEDNNISESYTFYIGEEFNISEPKFRNTPNRLCQQATVTLPKGSTMNDFSDTNLLPPRSQTTEARFSKIVPANGLITIYSQWWLVYDLQDMVADFTATYHGDMRIKYRFIKGAVSC